MNSQPEYIGHEIEGPDMFTDVSTLGAIPNVPGQFEKITVGQLTVPQSSHHLLADQGLHTANLVTDAVMVTHQVFGINFKTVREMPHRLIQVADTYQHLITIGPPIHIQSDPATFVFDEDEHLGGNFIVYSPFDYLDDENYDAALQVIEDVPYLHRTDSEEIRDRLSELLVLSIEDVDQRVMSANSLQFFIDFLQVYNRIRSPLIFMQESGDIRSEWRVSGRQALAIEFASDGTVEFIVFAPNSRRPSQTVIQSGDRIAWQDLIPTLEQCADMKWIWEPNEEHPRR